MLTRLKVSGFKNLVDVDVRFGPFTCVAGVNGVGKSNLFDAIRLLNALADHPLMDAGLSVRDPGGRTSDVRSLFHRVGDEYDREMSFEVEMIVPSKGMDDLGQEARATSTFLRYTLVLAYRESPSNGSLGPLAIRKEQLAHIPKGKAKENLRFPHTRAWWESWVISERRVPYYISTAEGLGQIRLHQDGGGRGRAQTFQALNLPRTVLSATNAAESPTALLARREMQSWKLLQLEPSALRKSDEFSAPATLGSDGSHLAATLYRSAHAEKANNLRNGALGSQNPMVYAQIANRLAQLIDDVQEVWIDRDERRELFTLYVTGKDKTSHAARALSDGTLRFLALAVLAQDPEARGVLCLEEPENGIHPERIPAMIQLLRDIATDADEPVGPDNPLRQVIVNTHSPAVVQQVPEDSLLVADFREIVRPGARFNGVCFSALPDTWRVSKSPQPDEEHVCRKGKLLAYLNPVVRGEPGIETDKVKTGGKKRKPKSSESRRVVDREDIQPLLHPLFEAT